MAAQVRGQDAVPVLEQLRKEGPRQASVATPVKAQKDRAGCACLVNVKVRASATAVHQDLAIKVALPGRWKSVVVACNSLAALRNDDRVAICALLLQILHC